MRWWTSDTHFGHESILGFGRERWATIDEHDRDLVDNWNDVVGAGDEVWHLGDVAWSFDRLVEVMPTLKGRITLVAGNHDSLWPEHERTINVGVDVNEWAPISEDDLAVKVRRLLSAADARD